MDGETRVLDVAAGGAGVRVARPAAETLMTCRGLVIGYRGRALLPAFDLEIRRGTFLAVVGRNGAGKSTWFKTLLGLLPPVAGSVTRARASLRCAYVPQLAAMDPLLPLHAHEIVLWGRMGGWSFLKPWATRRDRALVDQALDAAGARAFAHRPYRELSEGQKQRVMLARVLASEADVVLLDEPTAAMDAVAERETMGLLRQLASERGMAVVVVTHELGVPSEHADTVLFVDREAPAVVVGDAATVYCHPAFRRQYGDEPCARHTPDGSPRGTDAR